jgi:protein-disulfide isomerase
VTAAATQGLGGVACSCHIVAAEIVVAEIPSPNQELTLSLNRRELLTSGALSVLAGAVITGAALPRLTRPAEADTAAIDMAELAKPGPEGDIVLGSDKAPVTVIEYASMTCPHCARFSRDTFPELQKRYIDPGKVRFIFREFPLDPLAAAGSMLARCAGKDKYMAVVETLFAKQTDWAVREPLAPLKQIAKQFGFTEASFNQCLTNQKLLDGIQAVRDRAAAKFGVNSTPTFFINGKKLVGEVSIEELAKAIDPYLKEG